jgi:beta-glucanase (GH16 family)
MNKYIKIIIAIVFLFGASFGVFYLFAENKNEKNINHGYRPVWEDSFDDTALNGDFWVIEENGHGGGNNELQYYRKENLSVGQEPESGESCLIITAKKENFEGKNFTSGRLTTQDRITFKYGKLEARIKLPDTANGLWPAFWLLGADFSEVGWPRCGEIDILEAGHADGIENDIQNQYINGACHWGVSYNDNRYPNYVQHFTAPYPLHDGFHLYTIIWDENQLEMYLDLDKYPDSRPYYTLGINGFDDVNSPGYYFNKQFFIILNLAVGGHFTGIMEASGINALNEQNDFEAKMYIDYVRLYQKGNDDELYVQNRNREIKY